MTNDKTVTMSRELAEQIMSGAPVKPRLENYCCVGCGSWMPVGHPEAHEHEEDCPEEAAAKIRHWTSQLRALLAAEPAPPLIQTLHANGDRIAMEATIAQQAQRIADLERGRGEPVAWMLKNEKGRVEEILPYEPTQADVMPYWPEPTPLYAEQPSQVAAEAAAWINPEGSKFIWASTMKDRPFNLVEYCVPLYTSMPAKAAVVYPSVDEVMKLVMNYQDHIRTNVIGTTNWAANLGMHIIDKVKELNQ